MDFFMVFKCFFKWIESYPGLASWVQAIGSIGAIFAAGYFPIRHEKAKAKQIRRDSLTSLLHLANRLDNFLSLELSALDDHAGHVMWKTHNRTQELKLVSNLANEFPASMFIGFEMAYLSELRSSALYAVTLAGYLDNNDLYDIRKKSDYDNMLRIQKSKVEAVKSLSMLLTKDISSL